MSGETILSVIIGAMIGALVNWAFAYQASKETKQLQQKVVLLLRALESAGQVQWNRNAAGDIIGMVVNLSATATATSSASGTLTVGSDVEHAAPDGHTNG